MHKSYRFRSGRIIYPVLSVAFGLAAIYHLAAFISPGFFPPCPAWRHLLFIVLNIVGLLLSIRRWIWFWIPFTLLTIQQMISHGSRAYEWWTLNNRIDMISIIIMLSMPVMAVVLFRDFKSHRKQNYN